MDKGGRPKDIVWEQFFCLKEDKKIMAKCKRCNYIMSNRVDRMKTHAAKCLKTKTVQTESESGKEADVSENDNVELQKDQEKSDSCSTVPEEMTCPDDTGTHQSKRPRTMQTNIGEYIVKTNSDYKHELDVQVAKFFFACNIPFNAVEHKEFITLVKNLRPGYTPPNRKTLSGTLLDEMTCNLENEMKSQLQGKECTLVQDGWSNIHNDPVIASCLQVENKVFFLEATDCSDNQKTAEFCRDKLKDSMKNMVALSKV